MENSKFFLPFWWQFYRAFQWYVYCLFSYSEWLLIHKRKRLNFTTVKSQSATTVFLFKTFNEATDNFLQSALYCCLTGRNSDTFGAEVTLLLPLVFREKLSLQTLQQNERTHRYKAPVQYPKAPKC